MIRQKKQLTQLESWLLSEIGNRLGKDAREIFFAQLKRINLVRRVGEHVILNVVTKEGGQDYGLIKFPADAEEVKLATVDYLYQGECGIATLYLVHGFLSSILFNNRTRVRQKKATASIEEA